MVPSITKRQLLTYRQRLWRLGTQPKVRTEPQARAFLERVGLCLLFECEDILLPKLTDAAHDDADWWSWKDSLQAKRALYNGRVIAHKATLISMNVLPCFLAVYVASGGCEEYEEEEFYGRLSPEAVRIARWLDQHGPMAVDRLRLRLFAHTPRRTRAFHKALLELQTHFKIAVSGVEDRSWGVRVIDLFTKWIPSDVRKRARAIRPDEARDQIVRQLVTTAGAVTAQELIQMLQWDREELAGVLKRLLAQGAISEKVLRGTATPVFTVL
jgi:hypothetical protein